VQRHDLDPIALVFGATFAVLGLAYAITRWTWIDLDRGWMLGTFLVALGIAGIASATHRRRRPPVEAMPVQAVSVEATPVDDEKVETVENVDAAT
jgi:hypothetical protein